MPLLNGLDLFTKLDRFVGNISVEEQKKISPTFASRFCFVLRSDFFPSRDPPRSGAPYIDQFLKINLSIGWLPYQLQLL